MMSGLILSACTEDHAPPAPTVDQRMNHILGALDQIGAVRFPMVRSGSVLPSEMMRPVTWYWNGPLDQAVRMIAQRIGYQTQIPASSSPPVIQIDRENTTIAGLLYEMASASAGRAEIEIDVPNHVLRIIWHA